ncbi:MULTISPECIES: BTAD domain-containing putative transcriptional regulator [unclassified Kitasatospora]|uniref:BTAD domain-containing putative transcriptional regulator n=1 Tax=unclassified Kitasatospora TaxID=2633591 RepID=UPI001F25551F|nr:MULTISPECIES: BTAD domain-containing putative transcriptional regulator [unclassified Kitasatospora]
MTVRNGTEECPVRGPKARAMLALLLLNADRPVSLDRLAAALWGERPPATAEASLRNLVARLRRALGDEGGERLQAVPSGYLLRVGAEELDARLFERDVQLARVAHAAEDWATVLLRTEAVLSLWRGEPLGDLPELGQPLAQGEQWREDRLQALEWRFDAELRLGRPHGLVPQLTGLVGEHPLREAFHGQLMLALHQSDQRGKALTVYQNLRRTLVDELGIEPGAAVQEIHRIVLNADGPKAAVPPTAPVGPPVTTPAQLPATPSHFVGRQQELAVIRRALTERRGQAGLAVVSGMAGVGKSALAIHCADAVRAEFPDGQLFLNLRGATAGLTPLQPLQALATLLRGLGVDPGRIPDDVEAASALLRSTLAPTRTLLVLDDADSAAQVRPLLPAAPDCAVLVTSRSALATLGGSAVRLGTLTERESVALVSLASGRGMAADATAAARLVQLCGRLPLALRIVSARLAARDALPVRTLVEQLAAQEHRLDQLELDDLSVRQSLMVALDALRDSSRRPDREAATALSTLGALDLPEYSAPLMAYLAGGSTGMAGLALDRLVDVALLAEPRLGRFVPHDLVRDFARELAAEDIDGRRRNVERALGWYAAAACRSALVLAPQTHTLRRLPDGWPVEPFAHRDEALAWGDQEVVNLVALAERCAAERIGATDLLVLVQAGFLYLRARGRTAEVATLNRLALDVARRTGDLRAQAQATTDLAGAEFDAGRFESALGLIEEVTPLWHEVADSAMQQMALNNRGMLLELLGRDAEAVAVLEQALTLSLERSDAYNEAVALSGLGNVHEKSDPREAIRYHRLSIEAADRAGRPITRTIGKSNLGNAHLALGRPADALPFFEEALAGAIAAAQWHIERDCRVGLVRALRALYRPDQAAVRCRTLLELAEERADEYGQGLAHYEYGLLLRADGEPAGALAHWRSALRLLAEGDAKILPELRAAIAEAEDEVLRAAGRHSAVAAGRGRFARRSGPVGSG